MMLSKPVSCQPWPTGTLGWACAQVLSSTKERWLQTRVARESRPHALRRFYTSTLENGDPGIWFPLDQLRTWLEPQSEEMEHRQEKIDVARAWAAAAAGMRKKSRWSMVKAPMTATMATLHDLSIIPVSHGNGIPPKTRTLTGPTLVVTLALSSVKCNRDFPTRLGNRRLCISMVSVRKMVWT